MTTTSRAVCLNRISMSDLVMVEREVLERAHEALSCCYDVNDWPADGTTRQDAALRLLTSALQSVEGGVQGSIATKQESCPESAPRTETAIVAALRECRCDNPMVKCDHTGIRCTMCGELARIDAGASGVTKSDGGVEGHATASEGASYPEDQANKLASTSPYGSTGEDAPAGPRSGSGIEAAGIKPGPSDQLTKTPSADHDAGNLRGLAEPNHHQPHALSQGWRDDMENAPKEDPNCPGRHFEIMVAGGKYFTTADDWRTRYDHPGWSLAHWDGDGWCGEADEQYGTNYYYEPTHWMLKVAPPPAPENTPRDSSESTTGGAAPDHTTMEKR